jgi:methionyl-tRNA formyltransferase
LNIIYMGTPGFAVPALKRLIESGKHSVSAVVTQPDRKVGRGQKMQQPPVKELALEHNLIVLQPERIRNNAFDQVLRSYNPDIIVVAAYGKILPPEVLNLPRFGCINIHASILPKYRGAAPIQRAIMEGESHTGITIMQMNEGLDTGNIIAFEQVEIYPDDDTASLSNLLAVTGGELLMKVLDQIEADGKIISTPQNDAEATYAPIMSKKDGLLDWALERDQIICRIKGLQPWPGAFSFLHGRAWKILAAEYYDDEHGLLDLAQAQGGASEFGTVMTLVKGKGFVVNVADGYLLITAVQPPDKKPMAAADAINGKLVRQGDIFISDPAFLEGTNEIQ